MTRIAIGLLTLTLLTGTHARAGEPLIAPSERVLVLGDSITHAGGYVAYIEAYLAATYPDRAYDLINLGLPSETVSGLSEPYHPWPRPNVHERLGRALEKVKPDVVIACYGMNDGIYYPFSAERFDAYKAGIEALIKAARAAGARVILVTPPPFDPMPVKDKVRPADAEQFGYKDIYENYDDEVLARYAAWIVERGKADDVAAAIDVHGPINAAVAQRRKTDPAFTLSGDGVHINADGHRIMAGIVLTGLGFDDVDLTAPAVQKLLPLTTKRTALRRNGWLSEVGHKRPGMTPGKPIDEAEREAAKLRREIAKTAAALKTE